MAKLNFKGLQASTDDAFTAASSSAKGPADLTSIAAIKKALAPIRGTLPSAYRGTYYDPLVAAINTLTANDFVWLQLHPDKTPLWDALQAVLQNAAQFEATATDAFQELVGDLYDGFLSAESRMQVKLPDYEVIPPLVKWGNPNDGPYTWTVAAMRGLNIPIGVVNLPPAHAKQGLMAWATIGHETGGHDILGADLGLLDEIAETTKLALSHAGQPPWMAQYWADRVDETASDVLGLINMGPAAGIGLVGYFRGLMKAWGDPAKLRSEGPADDAHPGDVVRGYLAAATIRLLSFSDNKTWAKAIETEADKDVTTIVLAGNSISTAAAKKAASVVARAIAETKLQTLEFRSLRSIQDWKDSDETITASIRAALAKGKTTVPAAHVDTAYATHVVAAAVTGAALGVATPQVLQKAMIGMLKKMHDDNPSWGPLFVGHRGDALRQPIAVRHHRR